MQQTKFTVIILSLLGFVTNMYSNTNLNDKNSIFSGSNQSPLQKEDKVATNEIPKEYNFFIITADNNMYDSKTSVITYYGNVFSKIPNIKEDTSIKTSDNPLTIWADKATYNSNNGILIYYGNVFVMQTNNKYILNYKPKLETDEKDTSKQLQEMQLDDAKRICTKKMGCSFISGQKLTIKLTKERKIKNIIIESKDGKISTL
ncbi:hypothetical protein IB642_07150 [Allofrancisella guangzhouensis]|uniref:hypothetical protein n=1 Tax=Allofrancisella guangzhouensis TaxID=594679 RepID=UPI00068F905A|nr:hypothetical protein [Allofrancisella guangzhouensis]MBK2027803.1 hypothetical protein [Allofrancisella guangzhouensis]MBK2044793.1 hypothetical protein [Allofrancisella guangzhouensis]MBK2045756.1 hypothetical protein [Allofrancisella guangzhouensis]